jgi:hypothetical protein
MGVSRSKRAEVAERRATAMRLKAAGKTLDEIMAEVPGYRSRAAVSQDISRALQQRVRDEGEAADELRALELERLDALYKAAWEVLERPHLTVSHGKVVKLTRPDGTEMTLRDDAPTLQAIDRLLRIAERRAKLLGLDSPVKLETRGVLTFVVEGVDPEMLR